jgi:hypothetical protein
MDREPDRDLTPEEFAQAKREGLVSWVKDSSSRTFAQGRRNQHEAILKFLKEHDMTPEQYGLKYLQQVDPELHKEEDELRDKNMVTSLDVLQLHLSELDDIKKFGQAGIHSARTEELALEVQWGIIFGVNMNEQYSPLGAYKGSKDRPKQVEKLLDSLRDARNSREVLIAVSWILSLSHSGFLSHIPLRDLYWKPYDKHRFLSILHTL